MTGLFSGCAILPMSVSAAPRGRRVSASRLMTYWTPPGALSGLPPTAMKLVSFEPRSKRLNSCSLPRLRWMGWERKRGKLHEFNLLRRGSKDTSFIAVGGRPLKAPGGVQYVISLDADTRLPRGA